MPGTRSGSRRRLDSGIRPARTCARPRRSSPRPRRTGRTRPRGSARTRNALDLLVGATVRLMRTCRPASRRWTRSTGGHSGEARFPGAAAPARRAAGRISAHALSMPRSARARRLLPEISLAAVAGFASGSLSSLFKDKQLRLGRRGRTGRCRSSTPRALCGAVWRRRGAVRLRRPFVAVFGPVRYFSAFAALLLEWPAALLDLLSGGYGAIRSYPGIEECLGAVPGH